MESQKILNELVDGAEARKIIGVSDAYIYNEVTKKNLIPCRKIGRSWIFFRVDVLRFKNEREKKADAGDGRIHLKKDLKKS